MLAGVAKQIPCLAAGAAQVQMGCFDGSQPSLCDQCQWPPYPCHCAWRGHGQPLPRAFGIGEVTPATCGALQTSEACLPWMCCTGVPLLHHMRRPAHRAGPAPAHHRSLQQLLLPLVPQVLHRACSSTEPQAYMRHAVLRAPAPSGVQDHPQPRQLPGPLSLCRCV